MSAGNSVARSNPEVDAAGPRQAFEIPPELASRYDVRSIEAPGGGDMRVGLFLAGDRQNPAIEITDDRIVARKEDPETVASLVKIAQHNGWDRIDVEGSPDFRKAVWSAASREGLSVSGYEPTFAEQEQLGDRRREAAASQGPGPIAPSTEQAGPADGFMSAQPAQASADQAIGVPLAAGSEEDLSDGDRRLLLTLSRHTEDRKALSEALDPTSDVFQQEVQLERINSNREALDRALERALESPTLVNAFDRAGYQPDALRQMGNGGEWEGEVADAIFRVRSGLNRNEVAKDLGATAALIDEIDAEREDRSVEAMAVPPDGKTESEAQRTPAGRLQDEAAERRHESEELAELFLHGTAERVTTDPRLVNALQAQSAMEQHIGEVFDGDTSRMASASLESRQMISDVLRRGLDVSVREPTPVRQREPVQIHPELER